MKLTEIFYRVFHRVRCSACGKRYPEKNMRFRAENLEAVMKAKAEALPEDQWPALRPICLNCCEKVWGAGFDQQER